MKILGGENRERYTLTTRFNQDMIKNLFSVIRQKGAYNSNPTTRVYRTSFRLKTIKNFEL